MGMREKAGDAQKIIKKGSSTKLDKGKKKEKNGCEKENWQNEKGIGK